jgi:GTP-binding protein YchF
MSLRCGIVGLPNVGKSTLFNALTRARVPAENFPFCTVEPNHGVVAVPDERLQRVAELAHPEKATPTTLEFVDIAGLVKGASQGEGLGNQFLSHIQDVDAVAHLLRCFPDPNVVHVHGAIDPRSDGEVVETELLLRDLETVGRRLEKQSHALRVADKTASREEIEALQKAERALAAGTPIRLLELTDDERAWLAPVPLLTAKPVLFVANVSDEQLQRPDDPALKAVADLARARQAPWLAISARTEGELFDLPEDERAAFVAELKLGESGLKRFVKCAYQLLDLITFFTMVGSEVRAWTVRRGTEAAKAAGKIHSDFEKGFIRAEVMAFADLDRLGSEAAVREKGLLRIEGRDYRIQDGDVVRFRFNV